MPTENFIMLDLMTSNLICYHVRYYKVSFPKGVYSASPKNIQEKSLILQSAVCDPKLSSNI